jgi:hypothetical protein
MALLKRPVRHSRYDARAFTGLGVAMALAAALMFFA